MILGITGIFLIYIVYERKDYTIWEILALVPLGLNPYFLECLSYKFDAPFMALSILGAIAPLLYRKRTAWEYVLAVSIGTVVVCTSYQASSGIFPMCVILLAFRMWMENMPCKQIFAFCLKSVLGFGIGLIFFRIVIMVPISDNGYVSNSIPAISELLPTAIKNFKKYFSLIKSDFKARWKGVFLLLCAGFVVSGVVRSQQKKCVTMFMAILSGVLMLLLCFGLYPILIAPLFLPRGMYGFGVLITILGLSVAEYRQSVVIRIPALAFAWIFFVFSLTYGNALYVQKEYTDFRMVQVVTDLNGMEVFLEDKPVVVQISGSTGHSPIICSMAQSYNMLSRLIYVTFQEWWWGQKQLLEYYGMKNVVTDTKQDLTVYGLPVVKDSMYHTIYGNGNYVLIELK